MTEPAPDDIALMRAAAQPYAIRYADAVDQMVLASVQFAITPDDIVQRIETEMREKLAVELMRDLPVDATPERRVLAEESARMVRERRVL